MKFKIMTTQSASGKTKYYQVKTESDIQVLTTLSLRKAKLVVQKFTAGISESDFELSYSRKTGALIHWKDGTIARLKRLGDFKQFLTTIEANPNDTFQPRLHSSNSTEQQESSGISKNADEFNRLDYNNLRAEQASEEATSSLVHQNTNFNVLSSSGNGDFFQRLEEYDHQSRERIRRHREAAKSTECEFEKDMQNTHADCIELERDQLTIAIRLNNLRIEQGDIADHQQRIREEQGKIREGQERIRDTQQEIARELESLQDSYQRTRAAYLDAEAHFERIRPALDKLLERQQRGQLKRNLTN